jgi:hypothetical protein
LAIVVYAQKRRDSLSSIEIKEGDDVDIEDYDVDDEVSCIYRLYYRIDLRIALVLIVLAGMLLAILENKCRKQQKSIATNCFG